ncbi:hypothetical protein NQZ68_030695 [Dissostichus eleginoides]|nr:hypothetical protein NQZ68_030695 [Dissostichus eleginoides]
MFVNNVSLIYSLTQDNFAEPVVTLADTTSSSPDTMLVCSAYDCYPKHIRITWLRNGQEVTSGVTLSEVMTNGDWTYQVHSFLEITPGRKDKIRCMVQHASLKEPTIIDWYSALNKSERSYLIGGFCCLLFPEDRNTVPNKQCFCPREGSSTEGKAAITKCKAFYNPASS